jgi:syntaxin 18
MADLTPDFNICLKEKEAQPVVRKTYDLDRINTFLQEAYSINARIADLTRELRSIRPSYLSTAPPARRRTQNASGQDAHEQSKRPLTDNEREAIDAQSKQLLRQLNGAINSLKQAEEVRNQTAESVALSKRTRGGLGALGRWAAGGAVTAKSPEEEREEAERNTIAAVRESIIMYLQRKLEEAGRVQSEMMEVRLTREVEKSKSILYKSRVAGGIPYVQDEFTNGDATLSKKGVKQRQSWELSNGDPTSPNNGGLSAEQLQIFETENADLLKHYEDQLDQVRTAERSILEISELHSTLHANLQQQSEHIDQLVQDSYLTTENLGKGNKELKRASERRSTAQAMFFGTVGFCGFLILWDLFI